MAKRIKQTNITKPISTTSRLKPLALGYATAIISAACMILLGLLGKMGIYMGAVGMMQQTHMFFGLSLLGVVFGAIEAAVIGFVFGYAIAWIYNKY